jgi:6-phosphogluconolactonase (cycloisomerase 2 family)
MVYRPRGALLGFALLACCGRAHFDAIGDSAASAPGDPAPAATGMFLVVADGDGTVTTYQVDPTTYALAPAATSAPQGSPQILGVTPDGRFVYAPNYGDDLLYGYAIDADSGALSAIPGMPIAQAGTQLQAAIVHPSGKFVYIVNGQALLLYSYAIDPTTGALTPLGTMATGTAGAYAPAFDPTGSLLYISTYQTTIAGYAIDAQTGLPSVLTGSPFAVQSSNMIPAFDRTGRYLYLCANGTQLRGYQIDAATGGLSPVPGSPYADAQGFQWLQADPSGAYLVGLTSGAAGVFVWSIDAATGALSPVPGSPFASDPVERAREWGVFTPDGRGLYAVSDNYAAGMGTYDLSLLSFDPTTGEVAVAARALVPRTTYGVSLALIQTAL